MKYIALMAVALLIGGHELVYASSSSSAREARLDAEVAARVAKEPIVTIDQAIGFTSFDYRQRSTLSDGRLAVCVPKHWTPKVNTYGVCRGHSQDRPDGTWFWVASTDAVPPGRSFYGQKLGGRYESRLDIWWK